MLLLILHYLPAVVCGIHAVRSGRTQPWLFLLIIGGSLGAAVYFFSVWLPELLGGQTARRVGSAAVKALDPEREYRAAKTAFDDTPTVGNQARLGHAAYALGKLEEAEAAFRAATSTSHADDPDLITHHAKSLVALGRYDAALKRLEDLRTLDAKLIERPDVALLFAQTFVGLGRNDEAEAPFRWAADRLPGLEGAGRYAAFLAQTGKRAEAELALAEIDRRLSKIAPALRSEARQWRDLAAAAIAQTTTRS
jgi:hypothetical protein